MRQLMRRLLQELQKLHRYLEDWSNACGQIEVSVFGTKIDVYRATVLTTLRPDYNK